MAKHLAPAVVGRKDTAVIHIQLDMVIPPDYRAQFPYPVGFDAIHVARELTRRVQAGELPIQELLEMADSVGYQVTKPARIR